MDQLIEKVNWDSLFRHLGIGTLCLCLSIATFTIAKRGLARLEQSVIDGVHQRLVPAPPQNHMTPNETLGVENYITPPLQRNAGECFQVPRRTPRRATLIDVSLRL